MEIVRQVPDAIGIIQRIYRLKETLRSLASAASLKIDSIREPSLSS